LELAFVTLGAVLVTYGWYWGGVTEARTSAYAMGTGSIILGLFAAFNPGSVAGWSLFAIGAMFGVLATMNAWNESGQDRTYGLFALFFALAALLGMMADIEANGDELTDLGLGALVLAVVLVLHFISAALVPTVKGFRAFVGWITLLAGAFIAILGYAESAFGSTIL